MSLFTGAGASSSSEYSTSRDGSNDVFASFSVKHTSASPLCMYSP